MNIKSQEISFQYLQKRVNKNFTFSGNNNFQLFRSAQKQMTKKWNYELNEKYMFKRCSLLERTIENCSEIFHWEYSET